MTPLKPGELSAERLAELRSASRLEYGNHAVQRVYQELLAHIDALEGEREERNKAIIQQGLLFGEVLKDRDAALKAVEIKGEAARQAQDALAEMTKERDEYIQEHLAEHQAAVDMFCKYDECRDKLAASEAREVGLRKAIEDGKELIHEVLCKQDHSDPKSNLNWYCRIVHEVLSSTEPPALLGVLREVEEALDLYSCNAEGVDNIGTRALASLRKAMGVLG